MAMGIQLHSYSFFLPCMLFSISFFSAESHRHGGEAIDYFACHQTCNCGNISNIAYLFWGRNRPPHGGGGNQFKLTCQNNNTTFITAGHQNFTVVSINTEFHSMKLLQTALSVACPWNFTITSLDPAIFRFDNLTIQNLTVFYQCPSHVSSPSNMTCGGGDVAFFAKQGETLKFSECKARGQILVQGEISDVEDKDGLKKSVRNGFVVQYGASWDSCMACNSSGGTCGSEVHDASRFACYCRNGVHPHSCPKSVTSSFFSVIVGSAIFWRYVFNEKEDVTI